MTKQERELLDAILEEEQASRAHLAGDGSLGDWVYAQHKRRALASAYYDATYLEAAS